ncbi:hypothetical protein P43SY_006678 [Pythium insidiosum]|uniref:Importin N-terminal domain-containing protein n=1 Tax=Pythium insidiosum TaxID=114742 RepID=A0AAD5QAB9_PYTIN|nr:hypothetical protein P43SY_006678 [Pythium insidiosum]
MDAAQLQTLETLCSALYESVHESERAHAQQAVLVLQSSAEYIPQCQYVLDNSTSPYALLVASSSLTKLITTHWNNFTTPQRIDIRNYVLGYLAQKGPTLQKFVTTSLIQMLCRLTKFGWFDDEQHREIVDEVTKFLQATVDHCIIGLQILNELVTEMNLPVAGRNITFHRKIAVSFREEALFRIFQVSLTTLRQLQMHNIGGATPDQEQRLGDHALSLAIKALSFDFIGTNPDESADEVGSLQVPTAWRQVIQDPQTMQLLFDYYGSNSPPNTAKCLETLMLFASVRRNLFATDKDRAAFLTQLVCVFDLIYPTYFPVFVRAAEQLYDHPLAMTALLKFLQELAYNKAQRVMFDQCSANGILLFRELSRVVVAYGSRIQQVQVGKDAYAEKYKGISLCLGILYRALGGNYVNFGVFKLYNDQSLDAALSVALQLVLSVPHEDLMNYPKLKNSYYFFLEILFRNQITSVVSLDGAIFSQLVQSLLEGINSIDTGIAAQCATAVDHLATLYYHEMKKKRDTPLKHALLSHSQNNPTMWSSLVSALFDILVYGDASSIWALSRPILSLTLCSEDALNAYQQSLIASQPMDNQPMIEEAFVALFSEISPNLESSNRDKFTQRLGHFRNTLRNFLTIQ